MCGLFLIAKYTNPVRKRRLGARSGEDADGALAQRATSSRATPAAARKASVRKVTELLRANGHVAYPPAIPTDAQKEYSSTAYQSHEIL